MYVVVALSFFENVIKLEKISANSPEDALIQHSMIKGYTFDGCSTLEEMEDVLADCDMVVSVIEI